MATTPSNFPLRHSWRNSARLDAVVSTSSAISLRDSQCLCALQGVNSRPDWTSGADVLVELSDKEGFWFGVGGGHDVYSTAWADSGMGAFKALPIYTVARAISKKRPTAR